MTNTYHSINALNCGSASKLYDQILNNVSQHIGNLLCFLEFRRAARIGAGVSTGIDSLLFHDDPEATSHLFHFESSLYFKLNVLL